MRLFNHTIRLFAGLIQFTLYSALFFGFMLGAGYWVALQFFGGREVAAPDLTGVSIAEALQRLQPLHISLQLERHQPHVQVPKDCIISQYPAAGSIVKAGTPIRAVVSDGSPLVTVPDLRASNKIEAGIRLRKLGLNVGSIATIPRAGLADGTVLTTDPPAGAGVVDGSMVNLLLAAGEAGRIRQMPNLIGLTEDEAREVLESYGLEIAGVRQEDTPDVPVGHVHAQSPAPGETLDGSARIEITVQPARAEVPAGPAGEDAAGAGAQTGGENQSSPFFRQSGVEDPNFDPSRVEVPPAVELDLDRRE